VNKRKIEGLKFCLIEIQRQATDKEAGGAG
jgi:hypothetical protein